MPTYEYKCKQCDTRLEAVQSFSDAPLTECPACAGRLRKVFSSVGVVFKGSGFYRNDSRSVSANGKSDEAAAKAESSSTESSAKSETKSESTSDSKADSKSQPTSSASAGSKSDSKPAAASSRIERSTTSKSA